MMMTAMIQTMMAMMIVATTKKKRTCRCSTIPCVWILQLLLWKCLTAQWVIENHTLRKQTNKQFSSDNNIGWHENTELVEGRNKLFALSFLLWIRCHAGARPKIVQFIERTNIWKSWPPDWHIFILKIPGGRLAEVFGTKKVFGSTMVTFSSEETFLSWSVFGSTMVTILMSFWSWSILGGGFNINSTDPSGRLLWTLVCLCTQGGSGE